MIELYYWPTPNGHKITMFLEEVELGVAGDMAPTLRRRPSDGDNRREGADRGLKALGSI
jgi:hypothetical protein